MEVAFEDVNWYLIILRDSNISMIHLNQCNAWWFDIF